jgi:predicted RNA-binding protein with PUA-like domain
MSRAWFFQANPKSYDIDGALARLDHIWWRVPQYLSQLRVGDVALIWRSGADAGVVGVGRVTTEPQVLSAPDPSEVPFELGDVSLWPATEVRVRVRPTDLITKATVQALPALKDHPIVVAPRGTVFPIDDEAWAQLSALVAAPPEVPDAAIADLPSAFHWRDRAKGVAPMPGGYDGYLHSLRSICQMIDDERPSQADVAVRMEALLGVTPTGARHRESFLRRVGVIQVEAGVGCVGDWARRWLDGGDDAIITALLHSRCQFVGELLQLCEQPRSTDELLVMANDLYAMRWDTKTQIDNRRGWLQSAGMLSALDDRRVQLTDAGKALLTRLDLYPPTSISDSSTEVGSGQIYPPEILPRTKVDAEVMEGDSVQTGTPAASDLDCLLLELQQSSTDSSSPDRFERAVRDAFAFLGFRSEWIGGAGKTDVLLDALLGRKDSYRVIVDCKTSGSGSVHDSQVDWVTLSDHRKLHGADHVALVAPNPSGSRLFDRAKQYGVAVISADQLIGICRQHARSPLSLDDYREIFRTGGAAETGGIDERAGEIDQLVSLAARVCDTIRTRSATFGRLSARDLYLMVADDPVAEGTTEDRIQLVLDGLSNPLVGVLDGTASTGYRMTSTAASGRRRLRILGDRIGSDKA